MRFLVDECTGPAVARWLRNQSHEVFSVYEETRGITDDDILDKAYTEFGSIPGDAKRENRWSQA